MTILSTPHPIEADTETQMKVRRARQGLLVFACLLIPLSLFGYWFYVNFPDAPLVLPSLPLMLSPGLAAILTRFLRREGFADVSFRLRGPRIERAYLLAFALPLVVGGAAYGLAYLLGLARFDPPPFPFAVSSPIAQFALNVIFSLILIILLLPSAGGEEIGWRGYLLPRMIDSGIQKPILLTSLIWGAWHLPVVFAGVYAVGPSPLLSAAGLMIATLAFGSILAWIRLGTGSIWPCIIAHAAWNAIINGAFTPATQNATENAWVGETGILVAVALVVAAVWLGRSWGSR
ncbi:MAG TPA: type II CAAX endopeptidase family protein [Anaerolineales bacterium]|nr:type II CAAX endopeptidase family protein [Anaerolineales bacterium]